VTVCGKLSRTAARCTEGPAVNIDQIYIINLCTPPAELIARLNQAGVPPGTRFLIFEAIDGADIGALEFEWRAPSGPAPNEIGRALSHVRIWRDAKKNGHQSILVLEEHFLPEAPLSSLPKPNAGWDLVLLSRAGASGKSFKPYVKATAATGVRAYLASARGVQKLLDGKLEDDVAPIDQYLSKMLPGLNAFATPKNALGQVPAEQRTKPTASGILDDADWDKWKATYLDPAMRSGEAELVTDEVGFRHSNIYEFPLFSPAFCSELVDLAEAKGLWSTGRHQYYPTDDTSLATLGLNRAYNRVLKEIVIPHIVKIWQLESDWDNATLENFIVRYKPNKQERLSLHHDLSEVTCLVKLNDAFEGGGTFFPRYGLCVTPRRIGNAFVHPGAITHRHGARPIYAGKRYISVSFMRPKDN
jgi:hypothetical protein